MNAGTQSFPAQHNIVTRRSVLLITLVSGLKVVAGVTGYNTRVNE